MGHINKFKTRYYLLITIIVLGVVFHTSNAYADDVLNLRSVAYNGNKYNYYTDSTKFHTPASGYEVLLREVYQNNYYIYREIGPGVTDNISENHKAKGYGNYIFEPKTNLYKFLEWCYAKDQSMTEQACIVNGESENKSCTYEKLKGNSGKALNNEIRKFMNAFWINMQTLLSDKFNQYQDEYFFEKYVVKGLNAVGMSLGRIRQVQKNEDEEESAREYLTCMSSYMFSHTWEIAAPDTYTVEKGDVVPFLYYKLQVDETNPKELARYAYISLIEGWCTSLNGKHMWREEYEAQYGPYNEEEYDLEELKIWYDDCWQKYSKKRGKKGNNLLGADITVIIQSDYSIEYQLEATEYYLDKTFEDLGIERSYKENIARNNLMAEYMMQDSGLTETIKEYSVSIKFLEENLQRGTFEEKNTNTAVLSDYQFIKFNHPLNEDGHSDNDTLSDLTELTRNYKWMDITEFVRKTYKNLIASGNSVKETFEKQVDDIIYKNGNSDQVEDSGHIKKVTDADGSIKVLYRTYDYASNPVLEDTDFDGLRDDQDKLKLNNTFKGSSDGIGNVEYVNDFRWFYTDPNKYNDELAVMSLIPSNLANNNTVTTDQVSGNIRQYLNRLGFADVQNISDNGEVYVGKKTITYYGAVKNIYSIVVGEKNLEENYYNMLMKAQDSEGIQKAVYIAYGKTIEEKATEISRAVFLDNNFEADTYWVVGYGLGGSIASEIASKLTGDERKVFCYTFGAVNTGGNRPFAQNNIKNIINEDDYIPKIMNRKIYNKPGQTYSKSIKEDLMFEYRNIIGNTKYKGDYYLSNLLAYLYETKRDGITGEKRSQLTKEIAKNLTYFRSLSMEIQTDSVTQDLAIAYNNMTKANNDAHSIKSYYVLAKSLTGFDLLDGDEEKQNKYLYIPESLINAERGKENIKEGFLIAEALREIAKWYVNNVFTYQGDKSYDDFIGADKINGVSGHNIYMLGTGVDKRIELLKDDSANTPIFGGNYSCIGQKQGSDIEIRKKEDNKTYYFKRMTDNIHEFNYDSLCYIKASKEACENNYEYIKRSGSKLNYYIDCDKVSGFEYNDVGDDCTRFAFAVLELGTGEEAKNLGDLGDDAGQFIEGTTIGGTIEKMSAYFDIYTGNSFIEEYNKGLKDGDMLVSKIDDGESATKKNSRNHCEFIYNNTLNPIGVFGWGNVKKTTNSRARFSIKKNNTTNAEYVYNSEDGTYYSALYRRKTQ